MHGAKHWHWTPDSDPLEVILGAVLVQNTSWANAELALCRLRDAGALSLGVLRELPGQRLEELLRPSGQYRQKARKVRAFVELAERAGGIDSLLRLPREALRSALLGTWGIGPETADCIVLYAAGQPSFVVDAYTVRIASRLGGGPGELAPYEEWQAYFVEALPLDTALWAEYHALLVIHGRDLCRKRAPRCGECGFAGRCSFAATVRQSPRVGPLSPFARGGHA